MVLMHLGLVNRYVGSSPGCWAASEATKPDHHSHPVVTFILLQLLLPDRGGGVAGADAVPDLQAVQLRQQRQPDQPEGIQVVAPLDGARIRKEVGRRTRRTGRRRSGSRNRRP